MEFAGEVDKFGQGTADLQGSHQVRILVTCQELHRMAHINRNMTDNRCVIWQPNILGLMVATIRSVLVRVIVDYECSLNIDED